MNMKKIDKAVVGISLACVVFLAAFIGFRNPYVISPANNLTTTNTSIVFSFENADKILIDENKDFSSPDVYNVGNNLYIDLEPGVYYWKLDGITETKIRKLEVLSEVELKLNRTRNGNKLTNTGNVDLDVEYSKSSFGNEINKASLKVNETKNLSGIKFVGEQK